MPGLFYSLIYGFKYTNEKVPDQTGKVAIVTGGNSGIGYETCFELVKRGAKVYLAARVESRAIEAIHKIEAAKMKGSIEWLPLDLQDLSSVKTAAKRFSDKEAHLDVLYNNAGIMATPYRLTEKDGIEEQIQTNHVAQFLFTNLLTPKLEAASDPRVVNTSSKGHNFFKAKDVDFTSLERLNDNHGSTWVRYGQSKLANILFAKGLAERHPKILANSCHPGLVDTALTRGPGMSYGSTVQKIYEGFAYFSSVYLGLTLTASQGALTQLYLGTSEEVQKKGITGKYYQPVALETQPSKSATKENADKLWKTTVELLKQKGYSLNL